MRRVVWVWIYYYTITTNFGSQDVILTAKLRPINFLFDTAGSMYIIMLTTFNTIYLPNKTYACGRHRRSSSWHAYNVVHDLNNNKIFKLLSANELVLRNYTYLKPHFNILSILDNNIGNILPMRGYMPINTTYVYNNMYTRVALL